MSKGLCCCFCVLSLLLSGCTYMNSATNPSQIVGTYVAPEEFENYSCQQLMRIHNSLSQRENQLVAAQEQRVKTSNMQGLWYGYGQGDGVEASELANVRGRKNAISEAIALKGCRKS